MKPWLISVVFVLGLALPLGRAADLDEYVIDLWQIDSGLPHNDVIGIAQSTSGFLWLGTPLGLARFDGIRFKQFSAEQVPEFSRARVAALQFDTGGRIWVGLDDGALLVGEGGKFRAVTLEQGFPSAGVHGVYADAKGNIIISARDGQVFQATPTGLVAWIDARQAGPGKFIGINVERSGTVWVRHDNRLSWWATNHWELLRSPAANTEFFALKTGPSRRGGMWVAGREGLQRFADSRWQDSLRPFPEPLRSIQLIFEDSQDRVWVTTGDGHVLRCGPTTPVEQLPLDPPVPATSLRHLFEDDEGNLWAAFERSGLVRFSPRSMLAANFEGNDEGGRSGFRRTGSRIVFDDVWADSRLLTRNPSREDEPSGAPSSPLNRSGVRVPYRTEVVSIHFATINLSPARNLKVQYRLDEVDRGWLDAGVGGIATYTNLASRRYLFRVRVCQGREGAVMDERTLSFVVAAPFWRTWTFRGLAVGGGLGLLAWAYHARVSSLERRQILQQTFARQLIESQEAERQRIAADLHDSLGQKLLVIKNDAQFGLLTGNSNDLLADQLRRVSATASECLEEVRHIALNLRPYQLDQLGLTKALRSLVSQMERAGVSWKQIDMDDIDGLLPSHLEINVYRIVQEACSNILRHAAASSASLRLERQGREVHLAIVDNGCGFDIRHVVDSKAGRFGLTGMRERVEILGGRLELISSAGQGTALRVQFPIQVSNDNSDYSHRG